ncbi:MAG: site-specific integrase [Gaiellaceae bacterium]
METRTRAWETLPNALPDGMTLTNRELIDEFKDLAENVREETVTRYVNHLEEFAEWLARRGKAIIEARPLDTKSYIHSYLRKDERTREAIIDFDEVEDEEGKKNKRMIFVQRPRKGALSPSARKAQYAALTVFYGHCGICHDFDRNPLQGVRTPKIEIHKGLTLNRQMIRAFLRADGSNPRCRIQAYLLVYTAGRAGAFRYVLWSDIDFEAGTIHFSAVKCGREYTLYLHPELLAELERWREVQLDIAARNPEIAKALANPETAYVLLTRNGRQLSATTLAKQTKWRARRAGILLHPEGKKVGKENTSALSPHALRRTWATISLEDGRALDEIQDFLHHKEISTTRNHYAFSGGKRMRKVAAAFSV